MSEELLYAVIDTRPDSGPVEVGQQYPVLGRFATEDLASAFIGTLPDHLDGRYGLDGPEGDGENDEEYRRRKFVEELMAEYSNDWGGGDDLDDILKSKWAVVCRRDSDAWVYGASTSEDLGKIELGILQTDGDETEWIEGVYDINTGDPIYYRSKVIVEITIEDETVQVSSQ